MRAARGGSEHGRYRKVFPRLWRHRHFVELSVEARLLALYCLAGPPANRIGLFLLSIGGAAEDLRMTPNGVKEHLSSVLDAFGWQYDAESRVLWIPSWWKFNLPENANVLKGGLRDILDVPHSKLIARFAAHTEHLPETLAATFTATLQRTLPQGSMKRCGTQKQEQEHEPEPEPKQEPQPTRVTRRPSPSLEGFDVFWGLYPKKQAKGEAEKAWRGIPKTPGLIDRVHAAVRLQLQSVEWLKDGGRFIPHPATWLRARRWEDEPHVGVAGATNGAAEIKAGKYTGVEERDEVQESFAS
jgi:hypothetical protein